MRLPRKTREALAAKPPQLAGQIAPGRNKYGAIRTEYGGRTYDSRLEASCAAQLDLLRERGMVLYWVPQVAFPLPGKTTYRADFLVVYPSGRPRVFDAKGVQTATFRLKVRLMREKYEHVEVELITNPHHIPTEGRS